MATLTIRDLDESLKLALRLRAAKRNRSMEEEARQILRTALEEPVAVNSDLASRIRSRFAGMGDVQLLIPPREPARDVGIDDTPAPKAVGASSTRRASKKAKPNP